MSDISRKEAIGIFKNMLDAWDNYYTIASSDKKKEAVKLAIDSLEVDEAYQLEYEVSAGQRRCNKCKYYEGVHNIMGHAPCSYHKIGGVLWDWYCSQFESNISDHHKQNIKAYAHDFGISEEQAEKELRVTTKNDLGVEKTDMIDKSNFSQEQYKADLQSAYDCGFEAGKKAEQEPRWIPVGKKVPVAFEKVLVTYRLHYDDSIHIGIGNTTSNVNGRYYWEQEYIGWDILAWMPLPLCYNPQKSEG